jgi:hypothetical protein
MRADRVREVLGVWAPMAVGLFIIATAINFYFTASLVGGVRVRDLEPWRLACSLGTFFIGGLLILSTYGRYTKAKEARREVSRPPASTPPPVAALNQDSDDDGEDHGDDP